MKTIPLTNSDKVALVDDADCAGASQFSWALDLKGYVFRNLPRSGGKSAKRQFLHQFLIGSKPGFEIDHKDGDPLNNQRHKIRHATVSQNQANRRKRAETSSRYKGVTWVNSRGKWQARIGFNGQTFLGYFVIEEDAARAYDAAAPEHFGEFARLNFPQRVAS